MKSCVSKSLLFSEQINFKKKFKHQIFVYLTRKSINFNGCIIRPSFYLSSRFVSENSNNSSIYSTENKNKKVEKLAAYTENYSIKLPEEPQNCCMSGCAKCVWVVYAEELAKILNDGGEAAKQKILENVKDPNLRAFIILELSHILNQGK